MLRRFIRSALTPPMLAIAGLILLWEEWLWLRLAAAMARLARLPVFRRIEQILAALPPWGALAAFLLPSLILLPVNLFAVWLTAHGHAATGTSILIAAKLAGTAVLARIFSVCRPALLSLTWFRKLHDAFLRLRDFLYHSPPFLAAVAWKHRIGQKLRTFWRTSRRSFLNRRWHAIKARLRRPRD